VTDEVIDAPFVVAQRQVPAVRELPDAPFAEPKKKAPALSDLIVNRQLEQHFTPHARAASNFKDYIEAGFQSSASGLLGRGKAPDVALDETAPWYGRFAANMTGMLSDIPEMAAGYAIGSAGGKSPVLGTAGAFALPAGLRAVMMDAYTRGDMHSASDFIDRALLIAGETGKAWITGLATAGAGVAVRAAVPAAAPGVVTAVAPRAAEVATMTAVGKALEGQLPDAQDFVDAAIVIGGVHAAGKTASTLRTIYAKTGRAPEQVLADVSANPALKAELIEPAPPVEGQLELPGIPKAYQPLAQAETARAIVPGEKAAQVAASPFSLELPQAAGEPAKPTHVNYNYITGAEDTKLALARLSEVYEKEIQTQRRGEVSWDQTSAETAKLLSDTLGGVDTKLLMPREPGTPAGAAELLARKQLVVGAAEDMMRARDDLLAKGTGASPEDHLAFLSTIERASMIQSEFLGARAEAGRALNILKATTMAADRAKQIQDVINRFGGDPMRLATMLKQIDNPAGALKFAKEAAKATTWEKVVEAWKAGILSGPVTHMANLLGNKVFAWMRVPIDAVAAGIGKLHGGERVEMMEPVARAIGLLQGMSDGLQVAAQVMRTGEQPGKSEQFRTAIEGKKGELIRLPFRALSAEDAIFSTMNERAEAYTLATRQATKEGLNPLTREFRERIVSLVQEPTAEMAAEIDAAGKRFTFNTPMGKTGEALQKLVRAGHLEMVVPFIRTPGNILKEMTRMTPLAPLVKEWREAIAKGGAERDKAIAELAVGSAISAITIMHALDGDITGAGEPDAGKRRVAQAAGWQPYSIKVGDTYYSYQRIQPLGTLVGMAADVAEVWDHMTEEERDKTPKMMSVAFANAVTNQTALQGITSIVQVLADPQRYGPKWLQQYAGSVVPNIIGQPTQMLDPITREVDSLVDAVKARVPGLRGELLPKRDIFGEQIETKERLGAVSPVTESKEADDKVRTEAARLGLSASDAPKKVHVGRGSGKFGDVKLDPDQRERFADVGGHLAHEILSPIVNGADWDALPDLVKKRVYAKAFLQAHRAGALAAVPAELRESIAAEITEKIQAELAPADE
jgi:hypothetical protein